MTRWLPYLLVGAGSFIGGNARYFLARWLGTAVDTRFPLGTLVINLTGSFVLGLIGGFLAQRATPHADALRLALGIGFCGGYTTFSTFAFETHSLFEDGSWLYAIGNVVVSCGAGLVAVRLGIVVGRALVWRLS